jgi:hypothetical protein
MKDHKVVAEGFEHLINKSGVAQVTGKSCRQALPP